MEAGDYKRTFYQGLRNYEVDSSGDRKRSMSPSFRNTYSKKFSDEMKKMGSYLKEMDKRLSQPKPNSKVRIGASKNGTSKKW